MVVVNFQKNVEFKIKFSYIFGFAEMVKLVDTLP
jgi:hypothetical protein